MGAAKKIVPLERKTKKTELSEVPKKKKPRTTAAKKAPGTANLPMAPATSSSPASLESGQAELIRVAPGQAETVQTETVQDVTTQDVSTPEPTTMPFTDLARTLTREKSLTDSEVEAILAARPEPAKPESEATPQTSPPLEPEGAETPEPAPEADRPGRDSSRLALFASVAAMILLLGLYLHLNQNIKSLTRDVQDLASIKTSVATLDTKVGTMESRVADLETLPAKTRAALMSSILEEMGQKTSYMSTQLQSPEQQDKLMKAKELIQQVQTELNAQN